MDTTRCDVVVVGAGISGLAAAFRLTQCGIHVRVLEAAAGAGGVIQSVRSGDLLYERGPNSMLDNVPAVGKLLDELGLATDRIDTNPAAEKRFVVHRGRLVALPASPLAFMQTPLFSARAKLALLREPFIARAAAEGEESVSQFVTRRLGHEFLNYAIEPFVAGVYAGNPDRLSLRAAFPRLYALEQRYGSLIKGQIFGGRERARREEKPRTRARSFSFPNGLQTLTDALHARLQELWSETRVTGLGRHPDGGLRIECARRGERLAMRARAVIVATAAYDAASLLDGIFPDAAAALSEVRYAPIASVASVYRLADVGHPLDGFGFLVPRIEKRRILGTLFSSTMFSGRAGPGKVLLTTFVGGERDPDAPLRAEHELVNCVNEELRALLGTRAPPIDTHVTRWSRAIPQYVLGHFQRIARVAEAEAAVSGLFFCGSWRGGVAVADCLTSGDQTAKGVAAYIEKAAR